MPKFSVLIIEDEKNIQTFMGKVLKRHDYQVLYADTGKQGLEMIRSRCPDLILSGSGTSGHGRLFSLSGTSVHGQVLRSSAFPPALPNGKRLRLLIWVLMIILQNHSELPSFLHGSALSSDTAIVCSLTAPSISVLTDIKGDLILDFSKRLLTIRGNAVHLTPIEYKIVAYLAQNSGKVITYASILSNVWGPYADNDNKILRVNMANIRRKIEEDPAQPQYISTEVGVGYRMVEDEDE